MSDAEKDEPRHKPYRVLHVSEAWTGGIGTYLMSVIRQQLDDPRIESVHLVCSANRTPERIELEDHPRFHVHRYSSSRKPWKVLAVGARVRRFVLDIDPDLVHLHSTFAGVFGRIFRLPCPVVYCAHGWAFTQDIMRAMRWAYALVELLLARRTSALIYISQDEFRAAKRYGMRAPHERVILHGVRAPSRSLLPPLPREDHRINLGFVGRFDRQKGTDLLLEAFEKTRRADLHLYLVGDFERNQGDGLRMAQDRQNVTHVGWVPEAEIDDYIDMFDALIVPSRWEGFGLIAAEAMRNAKPVIVSNRGGLPEQVVDGFNGIVFPFGDMAALVRTLETLDKRTLEYMGENARKVWQSCFAEERAYDNLSSVYDDVLSTAPARARRPYADVLRALPAPRQALPAARADDSQRIVPTSMST